MRRMVQALAVVLPLDEQEEGEDEDEEEEEEKEREREEEKENEIKTEEEDQLVLEEASAEMGGDGEDSEGGGPVVGNNSVQVVHTFGQLYSFAEHGGGGRASLDSITAGIACVCVCVCVSECVCVSL